MQYLNDLILSKDNNLFYIFIIFVAFIAIFIIRKEKRDRYCFPIGVSIIIFRNFFIYYYSTFSIPLERIFESYFMVVLIDSLIQGYVLSFVVYYATVLLFKIKEQ